MSLRYLWTCGRCGFLAHTEPGPTVQHVHGRTEPARPLGWASFELATMEVRPGVGTNLDRTIAVTLALDLCPGCADHARAAVMGSSGDLGSLADTINDRSA